MIRHLLVTDVRRFRWVITGWLFLVGCYTALVFITPAYVGDRARYDQFTSAILLLMFVAHLAPLVLVPLIVQADAPVGTDLFWTTRPIPPLALLAAKAILLGLAVAVVPGVVDLMAMVAAHVAPREIVRIAIESALIAAVWLTILMVASAITATYPKFALLCASVVVAAALALTVMAAIMRSHVEEDFAMVSVSPMPEARTDDGTGFVVLVLGLIAAGTVALVIQYRRRQRVASVPAGAGAVALAFFAATVWPWPLLRTASPALPAWTHDGLRITADSSAAAFDARGRGSSNDRRPGRLLLHTGGVAPGWFATLTMRDGSLTLPDGTEIRSRGRGFPSSASPGGSNEPPQRVAVRQVLSVNRLADRFPPNGENTVAMILSRDEVNRLASTTALYRGSFELDLSHLDVVGTLPIEPGATFDSGIYRLKLLGRRTSDVAIAINAIETRATSMFDPGPEESYTVYAVNPARSEAVEALIYSPGDFGSVGFGVHVTVPSGSGFVRRGALISFSTQLGSNVLEWTVDEAWFRDAHLVVVRTTKMGSVVRTLDVQGVRVCADKNGQC